MLAESRTTTATAVATDREKTEHVRRID